MNAGGHGSAPNRWGSTVEEASNTGVRQLCFRLGVQSQGRPWLYFARAAVAVAWRTEEGLALEFSCMSESRKELLKSLVSLLYPRPVKSDGPGCDPGIHNL